MTNQISSLNENMVQDILDYVSHVNPGLVTTFRFRLDKVNQDEKDAIVSPYWANRVREGIVIELQEVQKELRLT